MMTGFYILASLAIIQGLVALLEGIRYLRFVRQSLPAPPTEKKTVARRWSLVKTYGSMGGWGYGRSPTRPHAHTSSGFWFFTSEIQNPKSKIQNPTATSYTPPVAVIAPCKGIDWGFRENIGSLLGQDYPDYEVIFVTESVADPAYHQIWGLLQEESHPHASLMAAGPARGRGQKVHNLLRALDHVSADVEVFAFVDSDVTVPSGWLRSLVAPLIDPEVGATTGYRWYIPARGNWCSWLRSMWNASIVTALGPHRRNFAWGGSTAIRRETFEAAGVSQKWSGACTEDYPLSRAVKDLGLYVKFVPQCLIPSRGGCRLRELLQFTTRQIILTRVYAFRLWLLVLITNVIFFGAFYGGLGILLYEWAKPATRSQTPTTILMLVGLIYGLGVVKSMLRQKAIELILTNAKADLARYRLSYWFLYPLPVLIYMYNLAFSALSRRIQWRGIRYEVVSPGQTLILEDESNWYDRRKSH